MCSHGILGCALFVPRGRIWDWARTLRGGWSDLQLLPLVMTGGSALAVETEPANGGFVC